MDGSPYCPGGGTSPNKSQREVSIDQTGHPCIEQRTAERLSKLSGKWIMPRLADGPTDGTLDLRVHNHFSFFGNWYQGNETRWRSAQ